MSPAVAPVHWGFLGAGLIAQTALAPAVHAADGAVLHAVGAGSLERARALEPAVASSSYEQVLADPRVQVVYIALHNDAHLPWTLAALDAGKHVLCEKPLGLSAAEVDAVATHPAVLGGALLAVEASFYRWHPRVRAAQERLAELGPVRQVSAGFRFAYRQPGGYRLDPARGGGALFDVGCYAVSGCLWAVGRGTPEGVVARADTGPTGVDLDTRLILDWDGATAEACGAMVPPERQWLLVRTDVGELELRGEAFTGGRREPSELWISDGRRTDRLTFPPVDPYRLMVEQMSRAVRGRPAWVLPLAFSRDVAAVLDAGMASARSGSAPVAP